MPSVSKRDRRALEMVLSVKLVCGAKDPDDFDQDYPPEPNAARFNRASEDRLSTPALVPCRLPRAGERRRSWPSPPRAAHFSIAFSMSSSVTGATSGGRVSLAARSSSSVSRFGAITTSPSVCKAMSSTRFPSRGRSAGMARGRLVHGRFNLDGVHRSSLSVCPVLPWLPAFPGRA